jgi:recombinational DNA repair protein (RecF pathway)
MAQAPTPKKTPATAATTRKAAPKTDVSLKHCSHCGRDLPADHFAPRKTTKDGLCIYCRTCNTAAALKQWAIDHPRQPKAPATKAAPAATEDDGSF